MDIFSIFTLGGGLAFFLYGMNVMSSGLEQLAGGKLEQVLRKMTSNRVKSMLLGAGITAVIQSSSAVTVMLVGLVNSGIMQLGQTIGVIMGSNIGTTVTAWLLSTTAIDGSTSFILKLFKPSSFTPLLALLGIIFIMMGKSNKKKSIGSICVGFAVLMSGMDLMSGAVEPLADSPQFSSILTIFENPVAGIVFGAIFTAVIQSSSASVGILQALSLTGSVTFGTAIPIIMGQNIGTCITALISSIGTTRRDAKRVAVVHVVIKVVGAVVWSVVFYGSMLFIDYAFLDDAINPVGIAVVHTAFNIMNTALLLPFTKQLEKIGRILVRDKEQKAEEEESFLDERLLATPSVAVSECNAKTGKMCEVACETLNEAMALFDEYTAERCELVLKGEDRLDKFEDKLGSFLVKVSTKEISDSDSRQISCMLNVIGNFERLGDHAVNLMRVAQEMHEKQISFSEEAVKEIAVLRRAVTDILKLTAQAHITGSVELAEKVEPLEQAIDHLVADIKSRHIARLKNGYCTIELGFVLSDLLTNYERISDHCSNIAVAVIEVDRGDFDSHAYLSDVKSGHSERFLAEYESYRSTYVL